MFAEDVLVEALGRLGFVDCVYHEVPVDLRDYYQVRGGRARTFQKAEILIPYERNRLASDAGFKQMETGEFGLVADSYDRLKLNKKLETLPQVYSEILVEHQIATIKEQVKHIKGRGETIVSQIKEGTNTKLVISFSKDVQNSRKNVAQARY